MLIQCYKLECFQFCNRLIFLTEGWFFRSNNLTTYLGNSISECMVDNSIIKPTYMLTYESATELLHLNLEEEVELRILSEAAALRLQWRRQQVGRYFFKVK